MFYLIDGRTQLYQWDINVKLLVSQLDITEVHFCNGSDDCALVVKTFIENNQNYVNIPNILLQSYLPIKAYAYVNDSYTKVCQTFKVTKRNKPSDYTYTETEIKSYEYLEKQLNDIIEEGLEPDQEAIEAIVENYMVEHPTEVPTKVSELENDAGYLTEHQSLDDYYTKNEIDTAISEIDECDTYYFNPEELVWNQGFNNNLASAPEEMIEFANRLLAGDKVNLEIYYAEVDRWIPATFTPYNNSVIIARTIDISDIGKEATFQQYNLSYNESLVDWTFTKGITTSRYIADKSYVDTAIANIDVSRDSFFLDFSNATNEVQYVDENMQEFIDFYKAHNNQACVYIKDTHSPLYLPASHNYVMGKIYLKIITTDINNVENQVDTIAIYEDAPNYVYYISNTTDNPLATKDYVQEQITNINIPDTTGYATEQYVNDAITTALGNIQSAEGGSY